MKDRNVLCVHYARYGVCDLGKECTLKDMQHCARYEKDKNRKPFRTNDKKQKLEKIKRSENYD